MKYQFIYSVRALKELEKLDLYTKRMIKSWIEKNLIDCEDPRIHGKALTANRKGEWRYRIGDYRLICLIFIKIAAQRDTPMCGSLFLSPHSHFNYFVLNY